jgi:uncharacterized delta-60 repeat protein
MRRSIVVLVVLVVAIAVPASAGPGDLDPTFSEDGIAFAFAHGAVATASGIDGQGRIDVVGYTLGNDADVAVARFLADGRPDPSFGRKGRVRIDLGGDDFGLDTVVLQPGGLAIAGRSITTKTDVAFVLRLTSSGGRYAPFGGGDGLVRIGFGKRSQSANAIAVTPKGRFVVGGFASDTTTTQTAVARLLDDGRFDLSFAGTGRRTVELSDGSEQVNDLVVLPGGAVLTGGQADVAGQPRFALARFGADGTLDRTFGTGHGVTLTDVSKGPDIANAMTVRPRGTIVLVGRAGNAGAYDWGLARYTADGEPDPAFGGDGSVVLHFTAAVEEATGVVPEGARILVVGRIHGSTSDDAGVARVRQTGVLEPTFGGGDGLVLIDVDGGPDAASDVSLQLDGRIVVAGTDSRGGVRGFLLLRLLAA